MIRVVHIITSLGSGGAERVLFLVASRSPDASHIRHMVVCLTDEGLYGPKLREAGIELICLGMQRGRSPITAFIRLVRTIRRLQPDVLMTWLYHADLMGTLAGRLAGVRRIVWNIRCSDMDFDRYAPTTRRIVKVLARLSRVPWAIVANSEAGRRAHEGLGYHPKRWVYLPNGFDPEEWKPDATDREKVREELGFSASDVVMGMVARVDPQKDHATFLEAARLLKERLPFLRLLLVGRDTCALQVPVALKAATVALGERRDVPRLMRACDLLVLSSAYGEGFPNVVGEAMASGLPCVVTDVGDAMAIVGDAGSVVPPRDPQALAAAIAGLVERPQSEFLQLSTCARQRIEKRFSVDGLIALYSDLFQAAASNSILQMSNAFPRRTLSP